MVIRLFNSVLRIADHPDAMHTRYFRDSKKRSYGNERQLLDAPSVGTFGSFEQVLHLIQQADIQFLDNQWNAACTLYTQASQILDRLEETHEEHLRYCTSQLAYLHFRLFHWKAAMTYYVRSLEDSPKADPIEDQSRDLMCRIAAARKGNAPIDDETYKPSCSWHH